MVLNFADLEINFQWKWLFRPRQRDGMKVEDYYSQFCDWRQEMISLSSPVEEEDYIAGFIENLRWDIRWRLSKYKCSQYTLTNAFYNAKFEETSLIIEENIKQIKADIVFDDMPSRTPVSKSSEESLEINRQSESYAEYLEEKVAEPYAHKMFEDMPRSLSIEQKEGNVEADGAGGKSYCSNNMEPFDRTILDEGATLLLDKFLLVKNGDAVALDGQQPDNVLEVNELPDLEDIRGHDSSIEIVADGNPLSYMFLPKSFLKDEESGLILGDKDESGLQVLSIYCAHMASKWNNILELRPRQSKDMSAEVYYDLFFDWKKKLEEVNYIGGEESYIDDFLYGLELRLGMRVWGYERKPHTLYGAFRRAVIEETMMKNEAHMVFDKNGEQNECEYELTTMDLHLDRTNCDVQEDIPLVITTENPAAGVIHDVKWLELAECLKWEHNHGPVFGNIVVQNRGHKLFTEMTGPILEDDLLDIKATNPAHYRLVERPTRTPMDSDANLYGKKNYRTSFPYTLQISSGVAGKELDSRPLANLSKISSQSLSCEDDILGISSTSFPSLLKLGFNPLVFDPGTRANVAKLTTTGVQMNLQSIGSVFVGILAHLVSCRLFDLGGNLLRQMEGKILKTGTLSILLMIIRRVVFCVFVWDTGQYTLVDYILVDKDGFEGVGKKILVMKRSIKDGQIKICNRAKNEKLCFCVECCGLCIEIEVHQHFIFKINSHVFSWDSSKLCSCGGGRQIFYWEVDCVMRKFRGHNSVVNAVRFNEYLTGYVRFVRVSGCRSQNMEHVHNMNNYFPDHDEYIDLGKSGDVSFPVARSFQLETSIGSIEMASLHYLDGTMDMGVGNVLATIYHCFEFYLADIVKNMVLVNLKGFVLDPGKDLYGICKPCKAEFLVTIGKYFDMEVTTSTIIAFVTKAVRRGGASLEFRGVLLSVLCEKQCRQWYG